MTVADLLQGLDAGPSKMPIGLADRTDELAFHVALSRTGPKQPSLGDRPPGQRPATIDP